MTATFCRSLEVMRIIGRKKGKIIIFSHKIFLNAFSQYISVEKTVNLLKFAEWEMLLGFQINACSENHLFHPLWMKPFAFYDHYSTELLKQNVQPFLALPFLKRHLSTSKQTF